MTGAGTYPAALAEIRQRAREAPRRVAVADCDGSRVTYAELMERIDTLADRIDRAARPGGVVGLRLPSGSDLVATFCACLATHRIAFPMHPATPEAELDGLRARCGMSALAQQRGHGDNAQLRQLDVAMLESAPCADAAHMPGGLMLQTSGTTARPKLVLRDLPSLGAVGANVRSAAQLTEADTVLAAIPLYHSYGVENALLGPLMAGATVLCLDGFDLAAAAPMLAGEVTVFPGAPFMFDALARLLPGGRSSLRLAYSAGSPLTAGVADRFSQAWGARIGQLYGASDIGSVTFNHPYGEPFDPLSVGFPMPGVSLRVLGAAAEPVAPGAEGQVAVCAPSMLTRYVDGPEIPLADGHFLTGDIGRLDARGRLTITGRLTLLIDVGGAKVNPIEVESMLAEHPAVVRCIVTPMRMSETVTRLRALYEPRPGVAAPGAAELRAFLRQRLAPHKIPRVFEARTALPVSGAGKVLRPEAQAL